MKCRGCGALMTASQLVCGYCGLLNATDLDNVRDFRLLEEHSALRCPNGCGELALLQLDCGLDVRAGHCRSCNGLFFATGALSVLIKRLALIAKDGQVFRIPELSFALRQQTAETSQFYRANRACPACSKTMARLPVHQHLRIELDQCRNHGAWLDSGELAELVYRYYPNVAAPRQHPIATLQPWQKTHLTASTLPEQPAELSHIGCLTGLLIVLILIFISFYVIYFKIRFPLPLLYVAAIPLWFMVTASLKNAAKTKQEISTESQSLPPPETLQKIREILTTCSQNYLNNELDALLTTTSFEQMRSQQELDYCLAIWSRRMIKTGHADELAKFKPHIDVLLGKNASLTNLLRQKVL